MPSTCPHCAETFNQWMLYTIHLELHKTEAAAAKTPKVKRAYTPAEKAAIVSRGERRLGVQHFYGGTK